MKPENDLLPLHQLPGKPFMASLNATAFGEHAPHHRIEFYAII